MNPDKLDASWKRVSERVKSKWEDIVWLWQDVQKLIGLTAIVALLVLIPFFVWDFAHNSGTRQKVGQAGWTGLRSFLISITLAWVVSKIWRKKPEPESPENESGNEQSV